MVYVMCMCVRACPYTYIHTHTHTHTHRDRDRERDRESGMIIQKVRSSAEQEIIARNNYIPQQILSSQKKRKKITKRERETERIGFSRFIFKRERICFIRFIFNQQQLYT